MRFLSLNVPEFLFSETFASELLLLVLNEKKSEYVGICHRTNLLLVKDEEQSTLYYFLKIVPPFIIISYLVKNRNDIHCIGIYACITHV